MDRVEQYLSKATLQGLSWADQRWRLYRQGPRAFDEVVQTHSAVLGDLDWDVVICGGTLGILLAASLVIQGWRVALVEKGVLRGRTQEWNISRQELQSLLDLELLTETQLETVIATEYNPARIGFSGSPDLWVRDVLNIGVDPVVLLETLKQSFLATGGTLLEKTSFQQAVVHPDGIS
ncbi:MAG: FAD-binding oxidoreductase, partial [Cyanobacteria bacterium P01_H01_bin.15]